MSSNEKESSRPSILNQLHHERFTTTTITDDENDSSDKVKFHLNPISYPQSPKGRRIFSYFQKEECWNRVIDLTFYFHLKKGNINDWKTS